MATVAFAIAIWSPSSRTGLNYSGRFRTDLRRGTAIRDHGLTFAPEGALLNEPEDSNRSDNIFENHFPATTDRTGRSIASPRPTAFNCGRLNIAAPHSLRRWSAWPSALPARVA